MAKLSAHGSIVGTLSFTTYDKRYMSDGTILKNYGSGWKINGGVKEGFMPQDVFEKARAHQVDVLRRLPAFAAYKKMLHKLAPVSKRWRLHTAIELMLTDSDGVWSECCGDGCEDIHADLDEVSELCDLYLAKMREANAASRRAEIVAEVAMV
jgi:hypothetical protein